MQSCWLLVAAFLVTGAAVAKTPEPLPLPVAPTLPVEMVLAQKDGLAVRPMVNPLAGLYGGVLIDAIDKAQGDASVKKNMPRLQEIRDRVGPSDFDRRMEAEVRAVLASGRISPNPQIEVVAKAWTDEEVLAKTAESGGVYLHVEAFHGFDSSFNSLEVSLVVTARKVSRKSSGKVRREPSLFFRRYVFHTIMPEVRYKVENASAWRWQRVSDDGLRKAIDEGIAQTVAMFAYDISSEGQAETVRNWDSEKVVIAYAVHNAMLVRTTEDISWYRERDVGLMAQRVVVLEPLPAP